MTRSPRHHRRHHLARLAIFLAQQGWFLTFFWLVIGLMGYFAALFLVVALAHPAGWVTWCTWGQRGCLGVGAGVVLRLSVFWAGWLPVRQQDLDLLAPQQLPQATQEALAREWQRHGWLTWRDVWQHQPRPRLLLDWPGQWQAARPTKKGDRPATLRDFEACGLLTVSRLARINAVAPPTASRTRARA